ncbi:hypothetical protein DPX16_23723 [Anabarilius grahami]|uniref:Zinc finger CCHC domain-containing protein n=1 Tax=Anabarilius grahami TaxID=495550 RepID=A0A3N0XNV7_ANAGA|nr:hypothetical protein DPX16_23723 [Anabarilius grahami]
MIAGGTAPSVPRAGLRNTLRFQVKEPMKEMMEREVFARVVLLDKMKLKVEDVYCLQSNRQERCFDVTLNTVELYKAVMEKVGKSDKECKEYQKQYGGRIRVEETETERQMGEGGQQEIIEQQVKEKETIGEGKEGREDAKEVEDAMAAFLEALNGEQFKVTEQYSDEVDDEMEVERQSAPDGSRGDGSQLVRKAEKKKERPSKKVRAESMLKLTFSEETEESLSTESQEGLEMDNARPLFQLTEEKDRSRNGDQKDESSGLSVTPISWPELVLAETEDTSLEGQEMEGTLKTE